MLLQSFQAMTSSIPENVEPEQTLEELRALPVVTRNFDTPEGAILCLEEAYRRRDVELACACRNFLIEGTMVLLDFDEDIARDPQLRQKNAVLSERSFRRQIAGAWPDLAGVESFFINREPYAEGIVLVTELQHRPDGLFRRLELLVARTNAGWRVVSPLPETGF